jgi:hypothetical protein
MKKVLLALITLIATAPLWADAGISDHIQFGDPSSEQSHRATFSDGVESRKLDTTVGLMKHSHSTREFKAKGAETTFQLKVSPQDAATRILLELQEVHDRRDTFGYSVYVGDKKVYFRTYEEISGGPNHYFIEIDRDLVGKDGTLDMKIVSESNSPLNLSQIWAYPDFQKLADEENIFTKLGFIIARSPNLAGIPADPKDDSIETAVRIANGIREKYATKSYDLGFLSFIGYARRSEEESRKAIDKDLAVSAATGLPYHFMLQSWWGGANVGPDGLGGYFSDLKYESVNYDPEAKKFKPSFPNQWGNSLWPTKNHPHLNKVNNHRIGIVARYLADRTEALRTAGDPVPPPVIYAEWGPNYGPDYNAAAVEAAKQDGVTLDPRDGLSREEAQWIYESYGRYFNQQVPTYGESLGRGHVIVRDGKNQPPSNPLIDNVYTHGFWDHGNPNFDRKQGYWQQCMNEGMWTSGELYPRYPQAFYDYILPVSRVTCVNLERAMVNDLEFMKDSYGRGLEFVTLFNCLPGDEKLLQAVDNVEGLPKPAETYDRRVLDVLFAYDREIEKSPGYTDSDGVTLNGGKLQPSETKKTGRITYRIADAETSFGNGLRLELIGSAGRRPEGDDWTIKVFAGTDPSNLQPVATLTANEFSKAKGNRATVDLGAVAKGQKEIFTAIELRSGGQPSEVELRQIAAFVPWADKSGQTDGSTPTMKESRLRSLWLQQRARLDRVIRDFRTKGGSPETLSRAESLRAEGRYATAHRLLTAAIADILPARYSVAGGGSLGPHPVTVAASDKDAVVQVELLSYDTNGASFRLQSDRSTGVNLQFAKLKPGTAYALVEESPQLYRLAPQADGSTGATPADSNGSLSLDLKAEPPVIRPEFPFEPLKQVTIPRAGKGKYEIITGTIRSFTPPSLEGEGCNGIVEMVNGQRYELAYLPWYTKTDLVSCSDLKSLGFDGITSAFRPGSQMTLEIDPMAYEGKLPRIYRAHQPVKTLLSENYTQVGDDWAERAVEVSGLHVKDYRGKKLYPAKNFVPGHVIYRIENDGKPFSQTAVGFNGRIILNPANKVRFYVRTDGGEWKECAQYGINSPGANNSRATKFIDVTDFVEGKSAFDLKVEIHTANDTWAMLEGLQVRTLGE